MASLRGYPVNVESMSDLRDRAAARLTGAATAKGSSIRAADALTVLHALASNPHTAQSALTLLHELQVHQVELDLQGQELRESREVLEAALRRQTEVYDCLPVGCFTIDARRIIHEMNRTGAGMLGIKPGQGLGSALDALFTEPGARRLGTLVEGVGTGTGTSCCMLTLRAGSESGRSVLVSVCRDPAGPRYLVTVACAIDQRDVPAGSA